MPQPPMPPSSPPDCILPDPVEVADVVRRAAGSTGVFHLGRASAAVADMIGEAWVPNGAWYKNGYVLVSADGLRQYRRPAFKSRVGIVRANLEWRPVPRGSWPNNGHIDIDPACP
jgi:hypothetical protein